MRWPPRRNVRLDAPRSEAGVGPGRVAVPDLDERALDGPAGGSVDDGRAEVEQGALVAVPDVATHFFVRDVVGTFGLLGGEDAADEPGRDGCGSDAGGFGFLGGRPSPGGDAEARGEKPTDGEQRVAASGACVLGMFVRIHPATVSGPPKSVVRDAEDSPVNGLRRSRYTPRTAERRWSGSDRFQYGQWRY